MLSRAGKHARRRPKKEKPRFPPPAHAARRGRRYPRAATTTTGSPVACRSISEAAAFKVVALIVV
jgi:hypothetical protein